MTFGTRTEPLPSKKKGGGKLRKEPRTGARNIGINRTTSNIPVRQKLKKFQDFITKGTLSRRRPFTPTAGRQGKREASDAQKKPRGSREMLPGITVTCPLEDTGRRIGGTVGKKEGPLAKKKKNKQNKKEPRNRKKKKKKKSNKTTTQK